MVCTCNFYLHEYKKKQKKTKTVPFTLSREDKITYGHHNDSVITAASFMLPIHQGADTE